MSDCTCECHPVIETCDRCCVKNRLIEEAKREYESLHKRFVILAECLHLQSENLNHLKKIKTIAESLVLNFEEFDKRFSDLQKEHCTSVKKTDRAHISKVPHKCPVCEGTGKDKDRLVGEPHEQKIKLKILVNPPCHACEGKSIVWG